jgi:hypothetical protein
MKPNKELSTKASVIKRSPGPTIWDLDCEVRPIADVKLPMSSATATTIQPKVRPLRHELEALDKIGLRFAIRNAVVHRCKASDASSAG